MPLPQLALSTSLRSPAVARSGRAAGGEIEAEAHSGGSLLDRSRIRPTNRLQRCDGQVALVSSISAQSPIRQLEGSRNLDAGRSASGGIV